MTLNVQLAQGDQQIQVEATTNFMIIFGAHMSVLRSNFFLNGHMGLPNYIKPLNPQ